MLLVRSSYSKTDASFKFPIFNLQEHHVIKLISSLDEVRINKTLVKDILLLIDLFLIFSSYGVYIIIQKRQAVNFLMSEIQ